MAASVLCSPTVSLSLEKVTAATPLDTLYLISLKDYSDWVYVDPQTSLFECRQVQHLKITTHTGMIWQLEAECSMPADTIVWQTDDKNITDCSCLFKVNSISPIDSDWRTEASMGFLDAEGNLKKFFGSRDFKPTGEFSYDQSDLDSVSVDGDLQILVWLSRIPVGLNADLFGQQYSCPKGEFVDLQVAIKSELFRTDPTAQHYWSVGEEHVCDETIPGFRLYADSHHVHLQSFMSVFDSPWLPTNFNYGDMAITGETHLLSLFSLLVHNYKDWISSQSTFRQVLKPAGQHAWLLAMTPGLVAHDISLGPLSGLDVDGGQFLFRFYMTHGDQLAFQHVQQVSSKGGVKSFSLPRSICDQLVYNDCCGFFIQILIDNPLDTRVILISNEERPVKFTAEMLAESEVIQTAVKHSRLKGDDQVEFPVDYDEETLVDLHLCLLFGVDNMNGVFRERPNHHKLLEKVYEAADFFFLTHIKDKLESNLGYKPQLPLLHQS